jgi:flagellar protein FliS
MKSATDTYLEQKILGATPERQAALLMEAGQMFLNRAIKAINDKNYKDMAKYLTRVGEIILEAEVRLNPDGGLLVDNLQRIYEWWTAEIMEAAQTRETEKLSTVSKHMGTIRSAWEELATRKVKEQAVG